MPRKSTQTWLILVHEERREVQVLLPLERAPLVGARPHVPALRVDRVRGRAEREQVHDHRLVVAVPVPGVESLLGSPAHGDGGRARRGPVPLDASIQEVGVGPDAGLDRVVAVEVALALERARHQQRRVDRRELDVLEARAGVHVEEVVEKSAVGRPPGRRVARGRVGEKPQRRGHALGPPRSRVTQPRSAPTVYAVSPNPTAATLENEGVGARSGMSCVVGSARSQNQRNVRCSRSSRNARSAAGSAAAVGRGATTRGSGARGCSWARGPGPQSARVRKRNGARTGNQTVPRGAGAEDGADGAGVESPVPSLPRPSALRRHTINGQTLSSPRIRSRGRTARGGGS